MVEVLAIGRERALFLYANYGEVISAVPHPPTVVGPVATFTLDNETTQWLFRLVDSILFGPLLVGILGIMITHILTRSERTDIPFVRHALPRRDSDLVVAASLVSGTMFYLALVTVMTAQWIFFP